jgi:hypothetical protein
VVENEVDRLVGELGEGALLERRIRLVGELLGDQPRHLHGE